MAVSTRSRDGDEAAARAAMAYAGGAAARCGIDEESGFRLKGAMSRRNWPLTRPQMLVAPAIPDFGRITRDGQVRFWR